MVRISTSKTQKPMSSISMSHAKIKPETSKPHSNLLPPWTGGFTKKRTIINKPHNTKQ